jgi:hypothetical protein
MAARGELEAGADRPAEVHELARTLHVQLREFGEVTVQNDTRSSTSM